MWMIFVLVSLLSIIDEGIGVNACCMATFAVILMELGALGIDLTTGRRARW
jgi:hypothetical protein